LAGEIPPPGLKNFLVGLGKTTLAGDVGSDEEPTKERR
jgi:hypothetical protein